MRRLAACFLFQIACVFSIATNAESDTKIFTTILKINVDDAKLAYLGHQSRELISMIKNKKFVEAEKSAADLRNTYEAAFDSSLQQYTFQSKADFDEFSQSSSSKFEWIDWGYKECLQAQAFIAAEKKDFSKSLDILKKIESVAPISAGTAGERGYILNQVGRPDEALSSYQKAYDLSINYSSQTPFRAMALRGIGYALIDLHRLDEAEKAFIASLEIEPTSNIAKSELSYIQGLRKSK